ncbi:MAG: metallophosphoesterase [Cytophagales bacterium]|nr:metallophosphoesterase [Rhizobacter sp.]
MRIAIVADSHLAERAPECVANWKAAAGAVARLHADLTVHLGDISLDGQFRGEELRFAASEARAWPTPMRFVPGNHDMGDGSGERPLDPARLSAYTASFGPDHWAVSAGRWELIGINAQLLGSGTPEEEAQWQWLEGHSRQVGRWDHSILFLHRPLVRPNAAEHSRAGRYVASHASERVLEGPLRHTLRAVVSGHTHQYLDRIASGVRHLWLPSTAFVLPDEIQARVGEKVVGVGVLELGGSSVWFDLLCPDGMVRHNLVELGFHAELRAHAATNETRRMAR